MRRRELLPTDLRSPGGSVAFLLKSKYGGFFQVPACSETVFIDVECPEAQFVDYINWLVFEGITAGCGGGMYCPANSNTRGQMAVFLVKTFGLLLYGP